MIQEAPLPTTERPAVPPARELMAATRPFMVESKAQSWFHLVSTFTVLALFVAAAAMDLALPLRILASLGAGLTMVRAFILVHDLHHGALFRGSKLAKILLEFYGLLVLTPTKAWKDTHNFHHAHTARTDGEQRGTFVLYTVEQWRAASPSTRFWYRVERHPLTFLFGYLTVFLISFGFVPFFSNPRRNWDSGLSLLVHGGLGTAMYLLGGPSALVLAFLVPFLLSGAAGAYLFYIQHNFEGMSVPERSDWSPARAALESSSYIELGPVLRWFTGDIGFHHVHHLNPRIPFYRLKAAMMAIPALQHPVVVKLSPRTILRSFRLKVWDPVAARMIDYRTADMQAQSR